MKKAELDNDDFSLMLQRFLPLLSSLLILLAFYIPSDFWLSSNIRPEVTVICVYYWLLNRPDVFNVGSVYILGIVEDVVSSAPVGSTTLMLLLLYILVSNLSKYFSSKPFSVTWYGFALLTLLVMFVKWLVVSIYYSQFLPISILMFSVLVTIAFYPFISLINAFIQNNMMSEEV